MYVASWIRVTLRDTFLAREKRWGGKNYDGDD